LTYGGLWKGIAVRPPKAGGGRILQHRSRQRSSREPPVNRRLDLGVVGVGAVLARRFEPDAVPRPSPAALEETLADVDRAADVHEAATKREEDDRGGANSTRDCPLTILSGSGLTSKRRDARISCL
jgi:hypothetical protein